MLPEHRHTLRLDSIKNPDGSYDYSLFFGEHLLSHGQAIRDKHEIAALEHAKNAVQVDEYLMHIQKNHNNPMSLVHRSDRFLINQGKTGDCYALAGMIGILSNPEMQENIERMATVKGDKLCLTFNVDMSAAITQTLGYSPSNPHVYKVTEEEDLYHVTNNNEELEALRKKGYDLTRKSGVLQLEISKERISKIAYEKRSATTNSLIVNILEHFTGNLINYGSDDLKSSLRANRSDSLLAHNSRGGPYSSLVPVLLGYQQEGTYIGQSREELQGKLQMFREKGLCLDSGGGRDGFIYVGIAYGRKDAHGKLHGRHALTLKDIELDGKGNPVGVHLINPWHSHKAEYFSVPDLLDRQPTIIPFRTPPPRVNEGDF